MLTYLGIGALLGFSAGIAPGPLLTLVVTQTLQHNAREGAKVAIAPLLTDLPIICAGLLVLRALPEPDHILGWISFAGAAFIFYLGFTNLRIQPMTGELTHSPPRSYAKGFLVNLLSPHPYLFWITVGLPIMAQAAEFSLSAPLAFAGCFYLCIVGTKLGIAMLVERSRNFFSSTVYLWTVRLLGILLMLFAVLLLRDGLRLTGLI